MNGEEVVSVCQGRDEPGMLVRVFSRRAVLVGVGGCC